jgi:hypothetical protein
VIYIWVRETTDWQNERTFLAQVDPKFRPKVELWNDTFDMPFHVFRHKLRAIANLLPFTPPKWICTTNNYAAIKGPENRDVLAKHTRASEWFKRPEPARVKWIERHLSIAGLTP